MKNWIITLLSIVVLAGSIIPCCPNDNCQDEISTSSQKQGEDKGVCSPFLACCSCGGFVLLAKQVSLPVPQKERPIHHQKITSFFVSSYYSSFFQPPRNNCL